MTSHRAKRGGGHPGCHGGGQRHADIGGQPAGGASEQHWRLADVRTRFKLECFD